ncbi:ATP-binding cassette domain-containing protein [bacterium]|nr:ATP-binding cassette domain-containing protein [bacterium]
MIEFIRVTRTYPKGRGVQDVSLRVEKGDWALLAGPAGAGKTTLLKMVYASEQPVEGDVLVGSFRIASLRQKDVPTLRRMLGVVDQDLSLLFDRTVYRNVALVGEVLGWSRRKIRRESLKVLNQVGLYAHLDAYPESLSYGERRRLAIARALVADPFALIADEPLGHLDPESARGIVELFARLHRQGATMLMATHRVEFFEQHHPKVFRIQRGRLLHS